VDWDDLRFFLAVARAGSMAGAARELRVEHTTVGRRLGALERALGVKLFARGPAGLALTAAGTAVLPSVEAMAEQVTALERRVRGVDESVSGVVRVTIPESGTTYFMHEFSELRARHPQLTLEILSDNRALDLRRGEADIAVRFRENSDPDLVARRAGKAGWCLYASRAYLERFGPLARLEDVAAREVIGYDAALSAVDGGQWIQRTVPPARIAMRCNTIAAAIQAATAHVGIAALPCFAAAAEPALVRVTEELIAVRDILVVAHPDLVKVARVRATIDFLVALFARDAAQWLGGGPAPAP
jgi:DNA-binding transcriptional LysR family regulator